MAGAQCKIKSEEVFNKDERKTLNKWSGAGKSAMKTATEWKNNFWTKTKQKWRMVMTEDAATKDIFLDAFDISRKKAVMTATMKEMDWAYAGIKDNPEAKRTYESYKSSRRVLYQIKNLSPEEVMNTLEYKQWASDTKGKGIDAYEKFTQDVYDRSESAINDDAELLEVHKRVNSLIQRKIDLLSKVDSKVLRELFGEKYESPRDLVDAVVYKLMVANGHESAVEYYNKILGMKLDPDTLDPTKLDIVALTIIDAHTKAAMLHNHIIENNINKDFIKELKNIKVDVIDQNYIQALEDGHPLKEAFNSIFHALTADRATRNLYESFKESTGDNFKAMYKTLESIAVQKAMKSSDLNQHSFFIENNNKMFPELAKAVRNRSFDVTKANEEIKRVAKLTEDSIQIKPFDDLALAEFKTVTNMKEAFENRLAEEANKNSNGILSQLAERFPDHTLITSNGTSVMNTNGKVSDIENNKEIHGHIVDLSNAQLIVNDVINVKTVQDKGEGAIMQMLLDGRLNIIPKEKAELFSRVKNEINSRMSKWRFSNISKLYTMSTLFAPWNLPGYIMGTQIWGNIGHTMMGDPSAMKYWGPSMKAAFHAVQGNYHLIENEDLRQIMKYATTSEGNGIHTMSKEQVEEFESNPLIKELSTAMEKGDQTVINKILSSKTFKLMYKTTAMVEAVSRGAMAYNILLKQRAGKVFAPPTANKYRVEHLWGLDPHLAAIRLSNDAHIDYNNIPNWVRKVGRYMPFLSFKYGSAVNMVRQFRNTYDAVKTAMKTGDWKEARAYLGRGAVGVAWRAGAAAFIWNTVMQALGLLSDDKRKHNNSIYSGNIFNEMFGAMGVKMDTNMFIPGTGVNAIDKVLRLNKGSQKSDVFQSAEQLIPGLDSMWRDGTGMKGVVQKVSGNLVSSASPLIKTPVELMMGGGTIYEDGYHAPDATEGFGESVVNKIAAFGGLGTITRATFSQIHGNPSEYRSDAAYNVNEWSSKFYSETNTNDPSYAIKKQIGARMRHMDVDGTVEEIRKLEYELQKEGKSQGDISTAIRKAISYNTIQSKIDKNPELAQGLSVTQSASLKSALNAQTQFLNTIGYGRW